MNNTVQVDRQLKFIVTDRFDLVCMVPEQYNELYNIYIDNNGYLNIIR